MKSRMSVARCCLCPPHPVGNCTFGYPDFLVEDFSGTFNTSDWVFPNGTSSDWAYSSGEFVGTVPNIGAGSTDRITARRGPFSFDLALNYRFRFFSRITAFGVSDHPVDAQVQIGASSGGTHVSLGITKSSLDGNFYPRVGSINFGGSTSDLTYTSFGAIDVSESHDLLIVGEKAGGTGTSSTDLTTVSFYIDDQLVTTRNHYRQGFCAEYAGYDVSLSKTNRTDNEFRFANFELQYY